MNQIFGMTLLRILFWNILETQLRVEHSQNICQQSNIIMIILKGGMAQGVGRQKPPALAPSREFFPVYREFGGVEDAQELGKGSFSPVALLLQQGSAAIPSQGFQLLWQSVEIHLEYAEKAKVRPKENSIFLFFFLFE